MKRVRRESVKESMSEGEIVGVRESEVESRSEGERVGVR